MFVIVNLSVTSRSVFYLVRASEKVAKHTKMATSQVTEANFIDYKINRIFIITDLIYLSENDFFDTFDAKINRV